jgi:predicted DNA-binding protein with PD1-like motif
MRPTVIRQPGPALEPRVLAAEGRGRLFDMPLATGVPLLEAVRRGFAAEGFTSGTVNFGDLALGPLAYVMPALSKTGENAAFYSDIFRPAGITRMTGGALTFGLRDDAPFFHCHALWVEADGKRSGGHILPEEAIVAEPAVVAAFGIDGAGFAGRQDPETNFKIFHPVAVPSSGAVTTCRAFAIRLRPNQDFAGALESFAQANNIRHAHIRGGVGSTIGARLENGTLMANFATEVFVKSGGVWPGPHGPNAATLDVGIVDYTGAMAEGRLVNGDNPVLMTFELAIEEMPGL